MPCQGHICAPTQGSLFLSSIQKREGRGNSWMGTAGCRSSTTQLVWDSTSQHCRPLSLPDQGQGQPPLHPATWTVSFWGLFQAPATHCSWRRHSFTPAEVWETLLHWAESEVRRLHQIQQQDETKPSVYQYTRTHSLWKGRKADGDL